MTNPTPIRSFVDQLRTFVPDDVVRGRLYADLTDVLQVCEWFVETMGKVRNQSLSQDELETLLVDIDTNVVQHLGCHLESLRKDMPALLNAIAQNEDDGGSN